MKLVLAALLLCGGTAFAQVEDPSAPPPGDPAVMAPPPVEMIGWSDAIIDRPITVPRGKLGLYGDLDIIHVSTSFTAMPGGPTMTSSVTAEGLGVGGGYGIDDRLEIGAEYHFSLNDFEIKGPLALYGSYAAFHRDKLTIGVSGTLIIDFNGGDPLSPVSVSGGSSTSLALQAGVGARYKFTDKFAVFTGNPIAPGILGRQLTIGLNNGGPVAIDIPAGVEFQASPQLYLWAETNLFQIDIHDSNSAVIFSDNIPLEVGALFAAVPHKVDLGVALNLPDLENRQFDLVEVSLLGRLYL